MFSTHVTSVCFVRNERDASEHAAVTLTPFLHVHQHLKCRFSLPFPGFLPFLIHHIICILSLTTKPQEGASMANLATELDKLERWNACVFNWSFYSVICECWHDSH